MIRTILEKDPDTNLLHSQYQLQQANSTCTTFTYAVLSLSQYVWIELHTESSPCDSQLDICVNLNQTCPPGFSMSISEKSCVCEPRIAQYTGTHQCTITNRVTQITRKSEEHFWVGFDDQSDELILHPLCPVSPILLSFLSITQTYSVHTTGQTSCVDVVRKVTVGYWAHLTASSAPTTILSCLFLLQ